MNPNPQKPWIDAGEEHIHTLYGNREGLLLLQKTISQLLDGEETRAVVGDGESGIEMIELDDRPPGETSPTPVKQNIIFYIIVGLTFTMPFATIYGFYHLIKLLINLL